MRKPVVDGIFYEKDFEDLNEQIESCFTGKKGPGALPAKRTNKIKGIIAPHAGYSFSGYCQAWAYKEIAESKFPKRYVIIGINHMNQGENYSVSLDDFETPFGKIKNDIGFGKELMSKCKFLKNDESSHKNEHSIEVQLPFLQYVSKDKLKDLRIVPVLISEFEYEKCKKLGWAIAEIDEDTIVIVSSDFTHYGSNYGYIPFLENVKKQVYEMDSRAINAIIGLDSRKFLAHLEKTDSTICGVGAILTGIEAFKALDSEKGHLLSYYTSGDLTNYDNAVGYAAIIFK
ncbi:MAG: AmmeMemoRadiSam system protein B [Candidatus Nanoarchaeia archaeon]|nr:AmmeMemoRadiSam system protein B [Candidatus Nanoarchaeia archaeon]